MNSIKFTFITILLNITCMIAVFAHLANNRIILLLALLANILLTSALRYIYNRTYKNLLRDFTDITYNIAMQKEKGHENI